MAAQVEFCTGNKYGPNNIVSSWSSAEELLAEGKGKGDRETGRTEWQQATAALKYKVYQQLLGTGENWKLMS